MTDKKKTPAKKAAKPKKKPHPGSENLRPAPKWEKGQSGNPAGKKPGTKNRSTILAELLGLKLKKKNLETQKFEDVAHPLDPSKKSIDIETAINAALIQRALKGDIRAIQEVQDTMYGKIKETKVLENPDGSALGMTAGLSAAQAAIEYQKILEMAKKGGIKKK